MTMVATTIEHKPRGGSRMVYHNTCVAEFTPRVVSREYLCDGVFNNSYEVDVKLNTGGYFTATTKKRMNEFAVMFDLPFRVSQYKGDWTVSIVAESETVHYFSGNTCEFTVTR